MGKKVVPWCVLAGWADESTTGAGVSLMGEELGVLLGLAQRMGYFTGGFSCIWLPCPQNAAYVRPVYGPAWGYRKCM